RVDFGTGRGAEDVLTSGGQLWQANDPRGNNPIGEPRGQMSPSGQAVAWGNGGGGPSLGNMAMPTAPTPTNLQAPAPLSAPSATPTPQSLTYNPATTPASLTAQQVGTPASLTYANLAHPQQ